MHQLIIYKLVFAFFFAFSKEKSKAPIEQNAYYDYLFCYKQKLVKKPDKKVLL